VTRDPRQHVLPGDPLRPAAEQVNALNRLSRAPASVRSGPESAFEKGRNIILVRNDSGQAVDRWGVLQIGGIVIDPSSSAAAASTFQDQPCVIGVMPTGAGEPFVVAIEPIASSGIGRAAIAGVVQCKLNVTNESDRTAHSTSGSTAELTTGVGGAAEILWKQPGTGSGKWAVVRLGDGGDPILLCKADQDLLFGYVAFDLQVWTETSTSAAPVDGRKVAAINRLYDIAAGAWVWVAPVSKLSADQGGVDWTIIAASDVYDGMYPEAPYAGYQCSTPTIGGRDLSALPGYDAEKKQALTHNNGCLVWLDIEDCPP